MKHNLKAVAIFLLLAAILILVVPTYQPRSYGAGAKVPSSDLSFMNADQEDLFPDQQNQAKTVVSGVILAKILPRTILFKQSSQFCFPSFLFEQKSLILRC